jgi:hypothetical protein
MATINDLLYNYQNTNEFVCSDGRMSVNGICAVDQMDSQKASEITSAIIESSKGNGGGGGKLDYVKPKSFDDKYSEIEDIPIDKKKNKFEWEMDIPTKARSFTNYMGESLAEYNSFVEENFGIPTNVQTGLRVGSAIYSGMTGAGLLGVVTPFAIPAIIGAGMNKSKKDEQKAAINREEVSDLQGRIDKGNFGSNNPTPQDKGRTDYGNGSGSKSSGSFDSSERGASLHG